MHNFIWTIRSLMKNVAKRKWKSIFRGLWDKQYREDIKYMLSLVRERPLELKDGEVQLSLIKHSHDINYLSWVILLRIQIREKGYLSLEPIKVIWDDIDMKYLVVDGNHRFAALKRELSPYHKIPVKVLVPKEPI